jgi:hypothetical protein
MSKERGEELFRALHSLLDAVTNLNLRDLEAEAKAASASKKARAESSTQGASTSASASSKGKAKDPDPDWTEVLYNPVPITPLSTRPRFSQVVGSSPESLIAPLSRISVEAVSLANHPVWSPAVIEAWAAMNPPVGGGGQNVQGGDRQGGPQGDGQGGPQVPQGGGGNGNGNGDGNGDGLGGGGNGQDGRGQAPLAYNNAAQFLAAWNTAPSDQAKDNLEQEAINRSPAQDVQFAAMMKINLRLQATVSQLTNRVAQAQGQVAAANVLARQAQAAAHGAANVDRFRPAAPPKYGDMKKGEHVGHWIPVIEDYLRTAPDAGYIRLASSYLEGGPRALWTNVYEAFKKGNEENEPPNPHQFFRETFEANYGLQDLDQKYWDTWNSLRMGPSQSITEYNVDFQQALTDLAGHVTDEQVKIEKYRADLQHDLRQLCRTSPAGTRWARLSDLMQYATLQWPAVQERTARSKKASQEPTKVGGKRKASGSGAKGSGRSSKPKLGASGKLSDDQYQKDMAEKLCHICRALRGYCRSSSGPAERSLHHGRSSPKFRLPDPCPLTCTPHAICLLAMRNERARRRRLNWPIYLKWC